MNQYYTNNSLKNNIKKTKIIIITNDKEIRERIVQIDDIILKHTGSLKILGTTVSEDLKWNMHLRTGKNSLLKQLKIRAASIRNIRNKVNVKFAKQLPIFR